MLPIVKSAPLFVYNPISVFIQVFFLFNVFNCIFPYFYVDHTPAPAPTGSKPVIALHNL